MKSVNVTVNPFELIDLLECTIHKKSNEHATARIERRISWDKEEEYLEDVLAETYATITVTDDSEEDKIVFNGVVTHFSIQTENGKMSEERLEEILKQFSEVLDKFEI